MVELHAFCSLHARGSLHCGRVVWGESRCTPVTGHVPSESVDVPATRLCLVGVRVIDE